MSKQKLKLWKVRWNKGDEHLVLQDSGRGKFYTQRLTKIGYMWISVNSSDNHLGLHPGCHCSWTQMSPLEFLLETGQCYHKSLAEKYE